MAFFSMLFHEAPTEDPLPWDQPPDNSSRIIPVPPWADDDDDQDSDHEEYDGRSYYHYLGNNVNADEQRQTSGEPVPNDADLTPRSTETASESNQPAQNTDGTDAIAARPPEEQESKGEGNQPSVEVTNPEISTA